MKKLVSLFLAMVLALSCVSFAVAEEPIVIQFWSELGGSDLQVMIDICEKFNASQDKVRVEHAALGGDLEAKLTLSLGDDAATPALYRGGINVDYLTEKNLMGDFSVIFDAYPDFDFSAENFTPGAVKTKDGKVYGFQTEAPLWGLWMNTELVAQYCPNVMDDGVVTWQEILDVGALLKDQGTDIAALCGGWNQNDLHFTYIELGGQFVTDDDNVHFYLDKDLYAKSIQPWIDVVQKGYGWTEGEDKQQRFGNGKSVFYTGGSWDLSFMSGLDFKATFNPLPVMNAEYGPFVTGGSNGFMLGNRNFTEEEAWATGYFLDYFFTNMIEWAKSGAVVTYKPVVESEEYKALAQSGVSGAPIVSPSKGWGKYDGIWVGVRNSFSWDLLFGHVSVEDFMDSWIKQTNEQIDAQ